MALTGYGDLDMFGRIDRMVNSMVRSAFGGGDDPFEMVDNMLKLMMMRPSFPQPFPDFNTQLQPMFSTSTMMNGFPGANISYSSSVMSISRDASGRPQIYEASESSRVGPDGVKETRSHVRDSASGLQKMSIGHHIQDRAHIMQRSKNYYTGEEEQEDQYVNVDDVEGEGFEEEWKNRMYNGYIQNGYAYSNRSLAAPNDGQEILALPAPASSSTAADPGHHYGEVLRDSDDSQRHDVMSHHSPRPSSSSSSSHHHHHSRNKSKISKKHSSKREKKPYRRD